MKVSASKREFNIFELFLHDSETVDAKPFSPWELMKKLNETAEKMYPERYVNFECSDISSTWKVWFQKDRVRIDDADPYPQNRVYDERVFRNSIPVELDEILLELNKADIVL